MTRSGETGNAVKHFEAREKSHSSSFPRETLGRPLDSYEGAALVRARSRTPGINPWLFVMATALNTTVASVLAVVITLGVVNQDRPSIDLPDVVPAAARIVGTAREPVANAAFQGVSLRPIGSPERPLQLEPQRPAPFALQVQPDGAANEPFILALSGAPAGTILLGAERMGSDTWFLPPGSANHLEIVLPEWSTSVFEIAIALRRTNGLVAAQAKAWLTVPPPEARPLATPKIDDATARDLLAKADRLIGSGDIVGARAIYQHAAELGSGQAALALGSTYDPNRLWSYGVLGLTGNKERARQWYQRASELGSSEAKARITALGF
jgi:hypothetical protein